MSSTNRLTVVINILPDFHSSSLPDFLLISCVLDRAPPPALRPMVADVLKKEEPGGDDNNVEEKL